MQVETARIDAVKSVSDRQVDVRSTVTGEWVRLPLQEIDFALGFVVMPEWLWKKFRRYFEKDEGCAPRFLIGAISISSSNLKPGKEKKMELYHGTTKENAAAIMADGCIEGPVYLTPNIDAAYEYGDGETVLTVDVPESWLLVDCDLPGGRLLDVESAADYIGEDFDCIDDFIDDGWSVGVESNIPASKIKK